MNILEDQYMFIILEAEIEDCEISLVEGILLCNLKRIASLVILKNDTRMILKTPSCPGSGCRAELCRCVA